MRPKEHVQPISFFYAQSVRDKMDALHMKGHDGLDLWNNTLILIEYNVMNEGKRLVVNKEGGKKNITWTLD